MASWGTVFLQAGWLRTPAKASFCCCGVLQPQTEAECLTEPGEHLAGYENQMPGVGECLTSPAATTHLGKASGTGSCPQTSSEQKLLASCHVPASKYFSGASTSVSVRGTTLRRSSAHPQGPPQGGLLSLHGSHLRKRHLDVSVGGPLGNIFKEMKALLSLHCENTITTFLFSCSLFFLKNIFLYYYSSPSSFKLGTFEPLFFLICPRLPLKLTLSKFKPARGFKRCLSLNSAALDNWVYSTQNRNFRNFRAETVLREPVWIHSGRAQP